MAASSHKSGALKKKKKRGEVGFGWRVAGSRRGGDSGSRGESVAAHLAWFPGNDHHQHPLKLRFSNGFSPPKNKQTKLSITYTVCRDPRVSENTSLNRYLWISPPFDPK